MWLPPGTVFVVGAGASTPFAISTGLGLIERILDDARTEGRRPTAKAVIEASGYSAAQYVRFAEDLRIADVSSIDEFVSSPLKMRQVDLAKCAIASLLLKEEGAAAVLPGSGEYKTAGVRKLDWLS
jgi:hypothetical protein